MGRIGGMICACCAFFWDTPYCIPHCKLMLTIDKCPIMANPSVEVKQRVVDFRPQPVGEGNEQNYPKEALYSFLTWGENGGRYQ